MAYEKLGRKLEEKFGVTFTRESGLSIGPNVKLPLADAECFIKSTLDSHSLLPDKKQFDLPLEKLSVRSLILTPPSNDEPYRLSLELVWDENVHAPICSPPVSSMHFKLEGISASIEMTGSRHTMTLAAVMVFNELELDVAVQLPALIFEASLGEPTADNVDAQQKLVTKYLPAPKGGKPTLKALDLMIALQQKSVLIHFAVDDLFTLAPLTLKEVQVDMVYYGSDAGNKSGRLWADLEITNAVGTTIIELLLVAELDASGGWQFEGSTDSVDIKVSDLLTALEHLFKPDGSLRLPHALSSLDIAKLSLAYNTADQNFDFSIEVQLEVEDTAVDVAISISLQSGDAKATKVDAVIHIGPYEFDVHFAKTHEPEAVGGDAESALIALYKRASAEGTRPPDNLRTMVAYVSPKLAQIVPPITVPKAVFGYHSNKQGDTHSSAWLFGIELGFDMNFSAGSLDLPVLSNLFDKDLSFGIESVQLLLTTKPLKEGVLAQLPHLDEFALPKDDLDEASISANLRLGEEKFPLRLNFGGEEGEKETANANGNASAGEVNSTPHSLVTTAAQTPSTRAPVAEADATGSTAGDVTWIKVQKQVSVLYVEKIGVRYERGNIGLLLDASLMTSGFTLGLVGFGIDSPLDEFKPHFELSGLGIMMKKNAVDLSAAFLKLDPDPKANPPRTWTEYDGSALLTVEAFSLSAVGSYGFVEDPAESGDGYPSLFIFSILDEELGDPTASGAFFITGLAGGLGYNRTLKLPGINGVADFPLVAGVKDPSKLGQTPGAAANSAAALQKLDAFVPPERSEYWVAGGLRFTSYDLINTTALLSIASRRELEISLLGLSWISLPPAAAPGAPAPTERYAYAEFAIDVKLLPEEGIFSAEAVLTPNSFVIDPSCKLTGGFAFYVWFGSNPHADEWVLTLGGYHPDFKPPSHFPNVPRLGFNWQVSSDVTIDGGAYFTLTPSAVMAGGSLEVLFHSGDLKAWFTAQMDALIQWAPLHYNLSIGISVGVSYRLHLLFITKTLKVELGADVVVWGPRMGGKAHIHWFIVSFTVGFGASDEVAPKPLDWKNENGTGFAQTLLPHKAESSTSSASGIQEMMMPQMSVAAAADAGQPHGSDSVTPGAPYTIALNAGGTGNAKQNGETVWLVRADVFEWTVATSIPVTQLDLELDTANETGEPTRETSPGYTEVGIRPMRTVLASSILTVKVKNEDIQGKWGKFEDNFEFTWVTHSVPAAKWGDPLDGTVPKANESLPGRLMGIAGVRAMQPELCPAADKKLDISMKHGFAYDPIECETFESPHPLPIAPGHKPAIPVPAAHPDSINEIRDGIETQAARDEIYSFLKHFEIYPGANENPQVFAAAPGKYLDGVPLTVGAYPATGQQST